MRLNPTRKRLLETFSLDTPVVEASGARLRLEDGREVLDFLSQYGALPFGHNHPRIWEAVHEVQKHCLPSMVQPLRSPAAEQLAERIAELSPGDLSMVTFTNSGAEAVEAGIKLARSSTRKPVIVSTRNGFHGKTLGALSATGKPLYQDEFFAPAPSFEYVSYGDLSSLEALLGSGRDDIAAVIVEPIQGEGGVIVPPEGYISGVIEMCRRFGVLSIIDEIQTGLGRTGALFATEACSEAPDILLLAKALGGGMVPIGACVSTPGAWNDRFGALHSSTFANNGLACAVANRTLDLLLENDRELIRSVRKNGGWMLGELSSLLERRPDAIRSVRGAGYMLGVEFHRFDQHPKSGSLSFASLNRGLTPLISSYVLDQHGILMAPLFNATHVLRLQPALIVEPNDLKRAVEAVEDVSDILSAGDIERLTRRIRRPKASEPLHQAPQPRPAEAKTPDAPAGSAASNPERFAFVIHYTEPGDVRRSDPSFASVDDPELDVWLDWVKRLGPGYARRLDPVTSATGARAEGMILSIPLLPRDMQRSGRLEAAGMVADCVDLAREWGASRIGLGAFTSIVSRGGQSVAGRGVDVTSGNSLTTVSAVRMLQKAVMADGRRLEDMQVAVVGATGAIGRLAAFMLARSAGRLHLVGNPDNPFSPGLLKSLQKELLSLESFAETPSISTSIEEAARKADVVMMATSSDRPLLDPRRLRPGVIVCDVSRPPNLVQADLGGSGVTVLDGGLVRPPSPVDLGPFQTLPEGLCWGCLGETLLLTLARRPGDFSLGGSLSIDQADELSALSDLHGVEAAAIRWPGSSLSRI